MAEMRNQELRRQAQALLDEANEMHERALADDAVLSGKELEKAQGLRAKAEEYLGQAEEIERLEGLDARSGSGAASVRGAGGRGADVGGDVPGDVAELRRVIDAQRGGGERASDAYHERFSALLTAGALMLSGQDLRGEARAAMQSALGSTGGYLTVSEKFMNRLLKDLDDDVVVEKRATKIPVSSAESLGVPYLDTDVEEFESGGELTDAEEDQMAFGKRELHPHDIRRKLVKIPRKLVRLSQVPIEQFVRNRLRVKLAATRENHWMTGTGANEPLGLFTASDDGIPTSRDISTGNTTDEVRFDGLKTVYWKLKAPYRRKAEFVFHSDVCLQIDTLKDENGQYLWNRDAAKTGELMLFGRPVSVCDYAPNTAGAGLYAGIFGDMSYYWIADAMNMVIQVLQEKYTTTGQIGLMADQVAYDGMPVWSEAFRRVTYAAE